MQNIICRFGVPHKIILENAMCFRQKGLVKFCNTYGIIISYSASYHPQGNGQVQSSNKNILKIIKRLLDNNKKVWDSKFNMPIWADRVIVKRSIGFSPFELVYGKQVRIPIHNLLPIYNFINEEGSKELDPLDDRLNPLVKLEENRRAAHEKNMRQQQKVKVLHEKRAKCRKFQEDWVLKWNAKDQDKGKHGKFESLWLVKYVITSKNDEYSYYLQGIDGCDQELSTHGQNLKGFFFQD